MNIIESRPVQELGYNFIENQFIPAGMDEYHLRNKQNPAKREYRVLTTKEIDILVHNRNTSDNWNMILVSGSFDANLVRNCKFFGLIRIGNLLPLYREFHSFKMAVGLYNSTIISCDLGDNLCIDNVNYLSHYIISNDVMIVNVNELSTTDYSKFGNGVLKDGEDEKTRTWIEVCNENGRRKIIPFDGMLPGDAYMWSKYRDDEALLKKFKDFTEKKFDAQRGYYGIIGERTVIKNSGIIKDTMIGSDAYIKGANKLKNLTINSDAERKSQIGEGCEMVNGIVGYGCRAFYGVKAVRFHMASHSQLKYGARLINSYLGNNSTISCCEVLNSLIFPSHEQHHNNSFLCASLVMGQSNIAAGATIGSNHNSRSADGELVAGRGFWPGLCVSLKHNSKFASFSILAKGDYPAELNVTIPFCLISNDVSKNQLIVIPAYWFMYNMYALERNAAKYEERDRRTDKFQNIEYNYLAPDTINEMFEAVKYLEALKQADDGSAFVTGWENNHRPTQILKIPQAVKIFKEMIILNAGLQIIAHIQDTKPKNFADFKKSLTHRPARSTWLNIGGQLIKDSEVARLRKEIKNGTISGWSAIHKFYKEQGNAYIADNLEHAYTGLLEMLNITSKQFTENTLKTLLADVVKTKTWMSKGIYDSREKDYSNPFRRMSFENMEEMNAVTGKLEENVFIQNELKALDVLKKNLKKIEKDLGL